MCYFLAPRAFQEEPFSLDDKSSRPDVFLLRRGPVVTLGCKHSLSSEMRILMPGIHQNSGLIFTFCPLLPQPGACPAGSLTWGQCRGLGFFSLFPAGRPSRLPWLRLLAVCGSSRGRGSNSCTLTSGFLARQMLSSASFSPSA